MTARKRTGAAVVPDLPIVPAGVPDATVEIDRRTLNLTNLDKCFWPADGYTKGDLLNYYARMAPVLLPHVVNRPMVMKRYPDGVEGGHFFMKRAPHPRPEWIETCAIRHASGSIIEFPVVTDRASLLWLINLGCIDLNPWYATCDDFDRPDVLHFDLDPVEGEPQVTFEQVREAALRVREALDAFGVPSYPKTTGSRGIHVYVPVQRGPLQKDVWTVAKSLAMVLAERHPDLLTAEYRVAQRPPGHVLVDYNQNAWGRTLASVYSLRPRRWGTASAPVTWDEVDKGIRIEDFRIDTMPERVGRVGDLWAPVAAADGRVALDRFEGRAMAEPDSPESPSRPRGRVRREIRL